MQQSYCISQKYLWIDTVSIIIFFFIYLKPLNILNKDRGYQCKYHSDYSFDKPVHKWAGKLQVSHTSQRSLKGYKAEVTLAAAKQQPWPFQEPATGHGFSQWWSLSGTREDKAGLIVRWNWSIHNSDLFFHLKQEEHLQLPIHISPREHHLQNVHFL